MIFLWIALGLVGVIVLFAVALFIIGSRLPVGHTTGATLDLNQPPDKPFDLLFAVEKQPEWDKKVTAVEPLPDEAGLKRVRFRMGRNSFILATTIADRPTRLQRKVADEAKLFGGTWTFDFTPTPQGCKITLTEHGEVYSAIPRAMMHFIVSPHQYLEAQLKTIAEHYGETPRITRLPYKAG